MKEFYYNNYPTIKSDRSFDGDQSSYHLFIKDFNAAMLRNGMIKAEGAYTQINLNNMTSVNIGTYTGATGAGSETNYPKKIYRVGDLYYTFNDELNVQYPIILKFSFDHVYVSITQFSSYANHGINVGLTIYRKINDSLVEVIPFTYLSIRFMSVVSPYGNAYTEGLNIVKDNSFINNINNSILSLSICPRFTYYGSVYSTSRFFYPINDANASSSYFYCPIIKFILNRRSDGSIIFTYNNTVGVAASVAGGLYSVSTNTQYLNFAYIPSNSNQAEYYNVTSTSSIFKNSIIEVSDIYNNKDLSVFPLEFYSTGQGKIIQNYDLLVAQDYRLLPLSFTNGIVKINIEGIGERSYRVINSKYTLTNIDSTGNIALLVRDE